MVEKMVQTKVKIMLNKPQILNNYSKNRLSANCLDIDLCYLFI